jgi:RNA polymerase sigma factor FliA
MERREQLQALRRVLAELPARERHVLERHFFDEKPLRGVGEELGVTESRVCQIVGAAVDRMRRALGMEKAVAPRRATRGRKGR